MKRLKVFLLGEEAGMLGQDRSGKLSFRYSPGWLAKEERRPLSQSLPLREEKFNQKECSPFFGGLLPEETNRENIGFSPNQARRQSLLFIDLLKKQCHPPENEIQARIQEIVSQRSALLRKVFS